MMTDFSKRARTLYVNRPVLNADEIIAWAKEYAGCVTCVQPDDMHVTIAFSKAPLEWPKPFRDSQMSFDVKNAHVAMFGPEGNCVVLTFDNDDLEERWQSFLDMGASWDWPDYHPHITLSYQGFNQNGIVPKEIPPFNGRIVLGPEQFSEVSEGWGDTIVQKIGWTDEARAASAESRRGHAKESQHSTHPLPDSTGSVSTYDLPDEEDGTTDLFHIERKADGSYYGHGSRFDASAKDANEMRTKLQRWKATHAGWESKKRASMNNDFFEQDRIQKRGARNNRADQMTIQQMHDHACALGATCNGLMGYDALTSRDDSYDKVARIAKVDESLGLVFGYAVVCTKDGKPYYDLNIDKKADGSYERVPEHIPEAAMLKAAVDFAKSARVGNEMHAGPDTGEYVFVFPMTADIAKAFNIETRTTGLMIAYKPTPEVFAKFKSGDYTGFSIEGRRVSVTESD